MSSADAWETPLGLVPVDTALAGQFVAKNSKVEFDDNAHMQEHSLEVQLPYLMAVSGGKPFKIVPILTNSPDPLDNEILAQALADLAADPKTLIVISSDLSHYPSSATAENVDKAILDAIKSLHVPTIVDENRKILKAGHPGLSVTMCGMESVLCVIRGASRLGLSEARVVNYTNSGMAGGDNRRVVGYGAMIFTGSGKQGNTGQNLFNFTFGEQSRQELLAMAQVLRKLREGLVGIIGPERKP